MAFQCEIYETHESFWYNFLFNDTSSVFFTFQALSSRWEKVLDPFYPFHFLESILKRENVRGFAAVTQALAYLPFFAKYLVDSENEWSLLQVSLCIGY